MVCFSAVFFPVNASESEIYGGGDDDGFSCPLCDHVDDDERVERESDDWPHDHRALDEICVRDRGRLDRAYTQKA